jgi:hypothetical protein
MPRTRSITVIKRSVNALNEVTMLEQFSRLCGKAIGKTYRGFGWHVRTPTIVHNTTETGHEYAAELIFRKDQQREREESGKVFDKQFGDIVRKLISAGRAMGWLAAQSQENGVSEAIKQAEPPQELHVNLPEQYASYFSHIFDRGSQIRVILAALQSAKATEFKKRSHCMLWGLPACGKSEILLAVEKMVGPDSVVRLDATSTTKAGAENLLLDLDTIPPILIIEEMEKCNPANLPWLLGVMDSRGEIIKTNARVGSLRREARCLVLATVNDMAMFQSIMSGALASRFSHKIYCPRPDRKVLEKILRREIKETGGNEDWIKPALDYCLELEKTNDPRRAMALLDGRDKLLTGEYQKDLTKIREAMEKDAKELEAMGSAVMPK